MIIKIDNPKIKYLSESEHFKDGLPKNCILDKGKIGSGGTTLALESKDPYVIAVPYKAMIENKVYQYEGAIFGVDGNTTERELYRYLKNNDSPKIMVTYNSLEKLTEWLETPEDYKLLIDEVHLLFTQYSFRYEAVKSVLDTYTRYKEYCFLTATVLEEEFILDELKHLPVHIVEWANVKNVNVDSVKCAYSVSSTVVNIINEFLSGVRKGDMYVFVNSVKFIKEMVKKCKLNDDVCMGVWSTSNKETNVGIVNSSNFDKPKKINFFTACCFEGSDLFNKDGVIFIVSDGDRQHTLIDISTSFQQIAGRIRDSKYLDNITHLYTTTRYMNDVTYEQFKEDCESYIDDTKDMVQKLSLFNDKQLKQIERSDIAYINKREGRFIFDPNLIKIDLYNFKVCQHLYKMRVNLTEEYLKNGYDVTNRTDKTKPIARMDKISNSFKDTVILLENNPDDKELYYAAFIKYDFLEEAIKILGFSGIKKEKYVIKNIIKRMIIESDDKINNKVVRIIENNITLDKGDFISNIEAKDIINIAYTSLKLDKAAKGTDLEKYFNLSKCSKRIEGVLTRGYTFISVKSFI
jgi:hypothetical protein